MMLTNYERNEKFKEIYRLLTEIQADENYRVKLPDNSRITERLAMAGECLGVAQRAIDIRQGVIEV